MRGSLFLREFGRIWAWMAGIVVVLLLLGLVVQLVQLLFQSSS